jgi:hypothetical protein
MLLLSQCCSAVDQIGRACCCCTPCSARSWVRMRQLLSRVYWHQDQLTSDSHCHTHTQKEPSKMYSTCLCATVMADLANTTSMAHAVPDHLLTAAAFPSAPALPLFPPFPSLQPLLSTFLRRSQPRSCQWSSLPLKPQTRQTLPTQQQQHLPQPGAAQPAAATA